jgi:DHA2 family methylenomycin A resistance protein-like MFS transporter
MLPGFLMIPGGMGLAIPAMTSGLLASVDRGIAGAARGAERLPPGGRRGRCGGVGALAAGGPERIVSGLRASGVIAAGMLVAAAWVAGRKGGKA